MKPLAAIAVAAGMALIVGFPALAEERKPPAESATFNYLELMATVFGFLDPTHMRCLPPTALCSEAENQQVLEIALKVQHTHLGAQLANLGPVLENLPAVEKHLGSDQAALLASLKSFQAEIKALKQKHFKEREAAIVSQWQQASVKWGYLSDSQQRVRSSSLKANMHTLQTMVETYAVDWGGVYPDNLEQLSRDSRLPGKDYWKDIPNPYTRKKGLGATGSLLDFSAYAPRPELNGLAIYAPGPLPVTRYWIYGSDHVGQLIQDGSKGQIFVLSNS